MKFKSLLLSSCSLLLLGSCATILSIGKQKIDFRTTPPNATVYINSEKAGNTPFFKYLKRNTKHHVKIELEGYKTFEVNLNKTFNPVVLGNILLGGGIGIIVDLATGAFYSLTPKQINLYLKENKIASQTTTNGGIFIHVALAADEKFVSDTRYRIAFIVPTA
jgi:hypothetical protein